LAELSDLGACAALRRRDGVAERFERLVRDAVIGQGADERTLPAGASDEIGIEPEQIAAQHEQLVQLEQAFELVAKQVDLHCRHLWERREGRPEAPCRWLQDTKSTRAEGPNGR